MRMNTKKSGSTIKSDEDSPPNLYINMMKARDRSPAREALRIDLKSNGFIPVNFHAKKQPSDTKRIVEDEVAIAAPRIPNEGIKATLRMRFRTAATITLDITYLVFSIDSMIFEVKKIG